MEVWTFNTCIIYSIISKLKLVSVDVEMAVFAARFLEIRNKRKETWLYTQMFRPQQPQRTNTRIWGNNGT
jgi:hypothetical protein